MRRIEFRKMFELEDTHFWFLGKRFCIDAILNGPPHPSKNRILDIGCGTGGTTAFLKKYGAVVGLENDPYAYRYAKSRNLQVRMGSADKLPFGDATFDMVTFLDVLYHQNITDMGKVIQEAGRVLSKRGEILITDSALPLLWSEHDKVMKAKRRFTIPELVQLLKANGFIIQKSSYYFFFLFPVLIIKRKMVDAIGRRYQSDVQRLPEWVNTCGLLLMKMESFLLRYITFPYGSSLIIYAKKNS